MHLLLLVELGLSITRRVILSLAIYFNKNKKSRIIESKVNS